MSAFGVAVRRDRKIAGLTLRSAAKKIGVNFTYLSKIEHGHHVPSAATASVIADVLGADKDSYLSALGWHKCPRCQYSHRRRGAADR